MDFRRSKTPCQSVCIFYNKVKLELSANIDRVYRKGQSRLYFLRWLRSFNVSSDMLCMFYHTIIESALSYAIVCWGVALQTKTVGAWTNW